MINVVTVSGYKPFELGIFKQNDIGVTYIKKALKKELLLLLHEGLEWVLISGQLGAELWTAEVVFELQEEFSNLKLAVLTPFLDQEKMWNEQNKEVYETVLAKADYINSITKRPYESPAQFRIKNQFLVEKSNALLLLYDHEKEGSPKYLLKTAEQYQEKHSYEIRLISFYDLQLIVEEEGVKSD